jgi:hypothetical protein
MNAGSRPVLPFRAKCTHSHCANLMQCINMHHSDACNCASIIALSFLLSVFMLQASRTVGDGPVQRHWLWEPVDLCASGNLRLATAVNANISGQPIKLASEELS